MKSCFGRAAVVLLIGAAASGCAFPPAATVPQLLGRATIDLQCPYPYVTIYPIDRLSKLAAGCGRRLVYFELCQHVTEGYACTWRLESSPVFGVSQPASPISCPAAPPTAPCSASALSPPSAAAPPTAGLAAPAPCAPCICRPKSPSDYSPSEL